MYNIIHMRWSSRNTVYFWRKWHQAQFYAMKKKLIFFHLLSTKSQNICFEILFLDDFCQKLCTRLCRLSRLSRLSGLRCGWSCFFSLFTLRFHWNRNCIFDIKSCVWFSIPLRSLWTWLGIHCFKFETWSFTVVSRFTARSKWGS